jgi:hypothetical protein
LRTVHEVLVGWTIIELIVIWAVGIFRREPA